MGLGDEIMCLGRLEAQFEQTGRPHSVVTPIGVNRDHAAWHNSPAYDKNSPKSIIDGGGYRPYITRWEGTKVIFNHDHRPRAGKICLTDEELAFRPILGDYVVIAPHLKDNASPNKDWGFEKWQMVADALVKKIKVVQLLESEDQKTLRGAVIVKTKTFRLAASVIKKAKLVLCNEGGSHHMAASMGTPAVVVFGAFVPPEVTGYPDHANFTTVDAHYCGDWTNCLHCQKALSKITPDMLICKAEDFLNGINASGIYRV